MAGGGKEEEKQDNLKRCQAEDSIRTKMEKLIGTILITLYP